MNSHFNLYLLISLTIMNNRWIILKFKNSDSLIIFYTIIFKLQIEHLIKFKIPTFNFLFLLFFLYLIYYILKFHLFLYKIFHIIFLDLSIHKVKI